LTDTTVPAAGPVPSSAGLVVEPIRVLYYALFLGYAGGGYAMWRQHGRERVSGPAAVASQPAA